MLVSRNKLTVMLFSDILSQFVACFYVVFVWNKTSGQ